MNIKRKLTLISNITFEHLFRVCAYNILFKDNFEVIFLAYEEFRECSKDLKDTDIVVVCLNFDGFYTNLLNDVSSKKTTYEDVKNDCIHKCGELYSFVKTSSRARMLWFAFEGRLNEYLHAIDIQAHELLDDIIPRLAKERGIDEELKAYNPLKWTVEMNSIRASIEEIVLQEVVYQ